MPVRPALIQSGGLTALDGTQAAGEGAAFLDTEE